MAPFDPVGSRGSWLIKTNGLGTRLYEARIAKGLSRSEAAAALGVSMPAIARWENGNREPNLEMLGKLVKLYETTYEALLAR